jgi:5-(carboxyamino)imidazole ribonucleotide synthase
VGGGQLAWMMAAAAPALGLRVSIQTPHATDTAVALADNAIIAPIDDISATTKLAQECHWITFENEFVDLAALAQIPAIFRPPLSALAPLLDKYDQRCFLEKLGLPVPRFCLSEDFQPAEWQFPLVLKARRNGYDGQGTFVLREELSLATARAKFLNSAIIEEFVPFTRELAVIAARSVTGDIVVYPVVETQQVEQVCRRVYTSVNLTASLRLEINNIAHTILEKLGTVGVMGIELFLTADERLLINELAPRTHNSGHLSIEACATSQFTQHLRAVAGMSLGDPSLICKGAVMVNLLGYETANDDYGVKRKQLAALPHTYLHWYGKTESRPRRKLGHVTAILADNDRSTAETIAQQIEGIWYAHA